MIIPRLPTKPLPAYHSNLLLVKLRPSLAAMPMGIAARRTPVLASPGISALSSYEQRGLIRSVTRLSRDADAGVPQAPTMIAAFAATAPTPDAPKTHVNAGVSVVELQPEADAGELQSALAQDVNVEYVSRVPIRYLLAKARRATAPRSTRRSRYARSAGSAPATALATPPAPSTMWNLKKIEWSQARSSSDFQDADDINVAVLDTGIDQEHPDLAGRVSGYVFDHPDTPGASSDQDLVGHGTHVSGTIGALINNNLGINGICSCKLLAWKIFNDSTVFIPQLGEFVYVVDPIMYRRALADCLEQSVDVINLSIGGPGAPDPQERDLFNLILSNGTTVCAAMGNERKQGSPTSFPAAIPGVVAVGATAANDTVANFSNRGNHISLSAPGVAIWSTLPTYPGQFGFEAVLGPGGVVVEGKALARETEYDAWNGTSMATPHVTAAVALLLANKGKMNPAEVRSQLRATADKVPAMGNKSFTSDYGAGRLNLRRLLAE